MNIEYGSAGIEVTYIKEFLKDHPIPSYHVYTGTSIDGVKYIDNFSIVKFINGKKNSIGTFNPHDLQINETRHLRINSTTYDTYTHKYLGDYLRYLRDYYKVDLMPLYNCYTGIKMKNIVSDLYDYYAVSVKVGKTYTVSLEMPRAFNIYLAFDNENNGKALNAGRLLKKVTGSSKHQPFTFSVPNVTEMLNGQPMTDFYKNERYLNAVFELPKKMSSSLSVVEAYCPYAARQTKMVRTDMNDPSPELKISDVPMNTRLSLFDVYETKSLPMAPRLIEYLLGSAITPLETIQYNVARVQSAAYNGTTFKGSYDIWDDDLRMRLYEIASKSIVPNTSKRYTDALIDELYYADKDILTMLSEVNNSGNK